MIRFASILWALALTHLGASAIAAPPPPVELVVFGDLQCPFTARSESTVEALREAYGDTLAVRWVHRPLQFHTLALPAAMAVEAAARQGAREALRRRLITDIRAWADGDFAAHARALGLDVGRFDADRASAGVAAVVQRDIAAADGLEIRGTPTFFVNGQKISGAQPIERFKSVIDAEIVATRPRPGTAVSASSRTRTAAPALAAFLYDDVIPVVVAKPSNPQPPSVAHDPSPPIVEDPTPAPRPAVHRIPVDVARDGVLGPTYAPVTMVVFTDYECPYCRRHEATLEALRQARPNDVRVVIRHSPLPFHRHAEGAAIAAICAREAGQSHFERMHSALMAAPASQLTTETYVRLAKKGGLDAKAFRSCLTSLRAKAQLTRDLAAAAAAGATGTPTTFVNGVKHVGARPLSDFQRYVLDAATEAERDLPPEIAPDAIYEHLQRHAPR